MHRRRPNDALPIGSPGRSDTAHDPLEGVSETGMITTGARPGRIASAFEPVIARALEHLQGLPGNPSLYVYGSVATGTARPGSSDVDLVTLGLAPALARRMGEALSSEFASLCRGVDVGPAQPADHEGPGDEAYGNRVFLRHYCVHLFGPDVARGLPDFPADASAARGFNGDIGVCAERWRQELLRKPCPASLERRIARKTLLAVAGLVSVHDAVWTTDRVLAARRWGRVTPTLASSLQELVFSSTAAGPIRPAAAIEVWLDGVVADVVAQFQARIGLWPRRAEDGIAGAP